MSESEAVAATSDIAVMVGAAVRNERTSRGWSGRKLAAESGVSQPFLTNVENGKTFPSIGSLYAIARALGIPAAQLLPAQESSSSVIRSEHGIPLPVGDLPDAVRTSLLAGARGNVLEVYLFDLPIGFVDPIEFEHAGEDFVYVISGALVIDVQGSPSEQLLAGDSLWWNSALPHRWHVPESSRGNARFLMVTANERSSVVRTSSTR